ncbi:sensor histidine kinase [Solicola sp. PLA-1-18]|uniref:sensor histidine kinase n=1 Tax=Solicola sp. PLA-1-18 TaxID=3380532 RepID=UPI003B81FBD7
MQTRSPLTALSADVLRTNGDPAVRLCQSSVTAVVLVVTVVEHLVVGRYESPRLFAAALVTVLVCQAAAFAVTWSRLSPWWPAGLPLVTIGAVCLMDAAGPGVTGMGLVTVVPAIWLGLWFRWPGVVGATLVAGGAFVLTSVLAATSALPGTGGSGFVVPLAVFTVANAVCMTQDLRDDQDDALRATTNELETAAAASQDSAELLNTVFEVLETGVLVLDADGEFRSMNPALHRMRAAIGATTSNAGDSYGHLFEADRTTRVRHEDMPTVAATRGEAFTDRTLWYGVHRRRQIAASVSAQPILGPDGDLRGAVMVYHDVTDRVLAVQAKDDFVASVSHELRTPLTSIIGYLELLEEDEEVPPRLRRHLDIVGRNADRLLSLVTDLLTVAQAEGGRMRLTPVESDLGEIVARAMDSARVRADAAGVQLVTEAVPVAPMRLDPGRIAQVVDNLVSNAVKYTLEGGTVTARVHPDDDEVVVEVVDTGMGISEDDQRELFTKFFRAREVERQAIPGVGLGLVISRAIVEGHGGRISVVSVPGTGTTVTVRLPR